MAEFEHGVAHLLQQWRIIWFGIILGRKSFIANGTLRYVVQSK